MAQEALLRGCTEGCVSGLLSPVPQCLHSLTRGHFTLTLSVLLPWGPAPPSSCENILLLLTYQQMVTAERRRLTNKLWGRTPLIPSILSTLPAREPVSRKPGLVPLVLGCLHPSSLRRV